MIESRVLHRGFLSIVLLAVTSALPAQVPEIAVNRTDLFFGADTTIYQTGGQVLRISNSGGGTLCWKIESGEDWIQLSPLDGGASGAVEVTVDPTGLPPGPHMGNVLVSADGAANSPRPVWVHLDISETTNLPFGAFETPVNGSTVRGATAVTGWVLDDIEVISVRLYYRDNGGPLTYVANAAFVEGARPDVAVAYSTYPHAEKAGWGFSLLTNFLPGDGLYTLEAIATDAEGHHVTLGSKDISVDNASAVKPFGAIDSPLQGGTASGSSYYNWGWVLTPQPNSIPTDGSTISVYVDGVNLGHPDYNLYRSDIATLFPGYANSDGAAGYFLLDTTVYENGIHTILWVATDTGDNSDGIGSRYFRIDNPTDSAVFCGLTLFADGFENGDTGRWSMTVINRMGARL